MKANNKKAVAAESLIKSSVNVNDRTIVLTGMVDEKMATDFLSKVLEYESLDPHKEIIVYIDTYGGYVDSMFTIYDAMQAIHPPVVTIGLGKVMSAGCLLLSGGTRGRRFISKHARTMLHAVSGFSFGKTHDVEIDAREQRRLQDQMIKCLATHTGASIDRIKKDFKDGDLFLTSSQILPGKYGKNGLADHILKKFPRPKLQR